MTGLLVGAMFGAVFVIVNAQAPLSSLTTTLLRTAAGLAAASVLAMWFVTARRSRTVSPGTSGRPGMFGRGYLAVVAAEVVLLFGGLRVLAALDRPEQGNAGWVAFVVGVHFVALAPVWKDWSIAVPGVALTLLGAAGLVLASTSALEWAPIVGGVLSGVVLLACGVTFAWRGLPRSRDLSPAA